MTLNKAIEKLNQNYVSSYHKDINKTFLIELFAEFEYSIKSRDNEIARLRKDLASGHSVNCNCSYCKMVTKSEVF